jgi:multiple sugar transport system permease protein/putative aldouronate transport system permease protein
MVQTRNIIKIKGDRSFHILNFVVLTIIMIIVLYPLLYVVSCSFSSAYSVVTNRVWLWPVDMTLDGYKAVFEHPLIMTGYINSLIYMIFGTMVNVILLVLCGYPLSRKDLPGRKLWTLYFMLTMFFNGGMIPNYLLVKNLGLINSRLALIIPFAFSAYNMVIVRTFFKSNLPDDLLEAANIDGCGDIRFFVQIALPLAKPVIAVMVLLHGIGHWNGYMRALLYVTDSSKFTLQLVLRDILLLNNMPAEMLAQMSDQRLEEMRNAMELIRYSVIIVGSLPVLILYPFVQKYFVKGIMIGSVKG